MPPRAAADTIAAISSPAGHSPRGIARLSGPGSPRILESLLAKRRAEPVPRSNYRSFSSNISLGDVRVPATIYVMRAPTSYTREDIIELHVFGNPALLRQLLDAMTRLGARPAEPGEFTRRAFLNGRIDLAQAEAVEALIRARSEAEYRAAQGALSGDLSRRTHDIRERLADIAAAVEVSLDFADHDVELITYPEVRTRLRPLCAEVMALLSAKERGRLPRQSVRVALYGPPNAGKSSLFNAILRRRRAIVSPHPGTTRDTIEAAASFNGLEIALIDTAGLRPPEDEVEAAAVLRSRHSVVRADLALCVLDAVQPPCANVSDAIESLPPDRAVILLNKSDLGPCNPHLKAALPPGVEAITVSAVSGAGIPQLLGLIRERVASGQVDRSPGDLMVSARQANLLRQALAAIERPLQADDGHTMELVASDIREALAALSELTGDGVTEDVLCRIFSTFCIGK